MTLDFNIQKEKKLPIIENSTIKWIYLCDITHIVCDGYLISVFATRIDNPYMNTNRLSILLQELEETCFVQIRKGTKINLRYVYEIN